MRRVVDGATMRRAIELVAEATHDLAEVSTPAFWSAADGCMDKQLTGFAEELCHRRPLLLTG